MVPLWCLFGASLVPLWVDDLFLAQLCLQLSGLFRWVSTSTETGQQIAWQPAYERLYYLQSLVRTSAPSYCFWSCSLQSTCSIFLQHQSLAAVALQVHVHAAPLYKCCWVNKCIHCSLSSRLALSCYCLWLIVEGRGPEGCE